VDWRRIFRQGTAVFHLEQQGPMMKISASADTIGATNMIYQVVDRFHRRSICRRLFDSFSKQIQRAAQDTSDLSFNYPQSKQMLVERNIVKGTSNKRSPHPSCVTDSPLASSM